MCKFSHLIVLMGTAYGRAHGVSCNRAIQLQLNELLLDPPEGINAGPIDEDDMFNWTGCVMGPVSTTLGAFCGTLTSVAHAAVQASCHSSWHEHLQAATPAATPVYICIYVDIYTSC